VTGLAETIEYVITPAVIVFFVGAYLTGIFETAPALQPLWWLAAYVLFVLLNFWGVEVSFRVSVAITVLALAVLIIFFASAIPEADFSRWALNVAQGADGRMVELPAGGGPLLPFGWSGAFAALPFAVWLYLAIEELPLAAEEAHDPTRDMPTGLIAGLLTLIVSATLVLFLNASIGGNEEGQLRGAFSLATSSEPILDGFRTLYGRGTAKLFALFAVIGLLASFHAIVFAYGRQIYSLSRAGYYLRFMSLTHGVRKTPYVALIVGSCLGLAVLLGVWYFRGPDEGSAIIGGTLLNMAVFGAMISYVLQGLSFIVLRIRMPDIPRPYRSPFGIAGAVITVAIALWTLRYQLREPTYLRGVYAAAAWYLVGLLYFGLVGRHRLVLSLEERFAMAQDRRHG
jgi:ethanolamine permease